ncbi:hypothetical protein FVE85_0939 [Porphyridium purpureum]|uniref:CAP N-terminal domain-containing protein n=1 Tax=Porphyridium purpureum TaxID=35688 RepID=A0A5J4Z1Q5_PORPP|nr:hypothetical protein FVE85_0939 [Porphyridium purpureum]|eukprot:POR1719..scf208_2
MSQALDTNAILHVATWGVSSLGEIAKERLDKDTLDGSFQVAARSHANAKALWNHWDASMNRLEELAKLLPRKKKQLRTRLAQDEVDYDPGERFLQIVGPTMEKLEDVCDTIAKKNDLIEDAFSDFEDAVDALAELIVYASRVPKPLDMNDLKTQCLPLISAINTVVEYKDDVKPRDPYLNHYVSIAEAASSLLWVISPTPVKHMNDFKRIVSIYTENILASYIELECDPIHSEYSQHLNDFMNILAEYVMREHGAGLKWNYTKGAVPLGYKAATALSVQNAHVLADFVLIREGSLQSVMYYSELIGGTLWKQMKSIDDVFKEEFKLICLAQTKQKPSSLAELKMLFMPTMHEISAVMKVADETPMDDRCDQHVRIVREAVSVLTWPVVEDITPLNYVVDIDSSLRPYYEKFQIYYSSAANNGHVHLLWLNAVKRLMRDLRFYVHVHAEYALEFGVGHTTEEVPDALKKRELAYEVATLKKKNADKVKHFKIGEKKGSMFGKSLAV